MSQGETRIICRRCDENIPADSDNCPRCGASIRGTGSMIVIGVVGLIIAVSAVLNPEVLEFGALGLILFATGSYFLYDKRKRISEAAENEGAASVLGASEEPE